MLAFFASACVDSSQPTRAEAKGESPLAVAKGDSQSPSAIQDIAETKNVSGPERDGEDWPEFLGSRQNGISGETGLLEKWPANGPPILWKRTIGEGYAAPSVRGNRLVLFHRPLDGRIAGDEEVVECMTADKGERLWIKKTPTEYIDPYGYNGGPRCAPLLTEDRCYTFGAEGRLACWNLVDGERIWERHTGADPEFQIPQAFFGVGATPILEGNRLIVMLGAHPNAGVVAFDATTGKTLWKSVGPDSFPQPPVRIERRDRPPAKLTSYASPLAATIHGKRHVLCFMRPGLVSVDPESGEVNFSYWFRSQLHDSVNAARPVVVGDRIFLSAAYETGAALLKVHADGKGYDVVWRNEDAMQTHWSTSIHDDGYLYGFSGRHEVGSSFRCIEMQTGKQKWETSEPFGKNDAPDPKDGRGRNKPEYYGRGSAILAEGKFIVLGERGLLALVEANPKAFKEISRVQFPEAGYPSWAAPVLSRKRLYLNVAREVIDRSGRYYHDYHLICVELGK
jgi:outer membrane protein assembly factor BamB